MSIIELSVKQKRSERFGLIDILVNVVMPLLLGVSIYYSIFDLALLPEIRNFIPDALWAYAFTSCVLIVWNREVNVIWIGIVFVSFFTFELLQYIHLANGTADYIDILVYFISSLIALIANGAILKRKNIKPK